MLGAALAGVFAASTQPAEAAGRATVTIDPTRILNRSTGNRLGINTDYWWDADANRAPGRRSLRAGLHQLGVRYLRYPGGEKSDGTLWFRRGEPLVPTPTLARISASDWPSNDPAYWSPAGSRSGGWAHPIYGFDTFMADCRAVGGEPVVVVALDGIYLPAAPGGTAMTKAEAIYNAREFVRYANVVKGYGVRYWEIGNEPWCPGYLGGQPDPAVYAADLADVAAAMKAVDPTIQVGASGHTVQYYAGILDQAAASVDFLTLHPYPTAGQTYADYQAEPLTALREYHAAIRALAAHPAHRDRIWLAATETAHLGGTNDLGSAVITADLLGQLLAQPRLRFVQFWSTRWINNATTPGESHDALDRRNHLTPCGRALAMWGSSMIGQVVGATSRNDAVVPYAVRDARTGRVAVMLINRSSSAQRVTVRVPGRSHGVRHHLTGDGPADLAPTYAKVGRVTLTRGVSAAMTLPAVSVTRLDLTR